jgi:hypothetical protein
MVEEYLRQAGVPLAFVDDLAEQMLGFARKVGLPDADDPEGIANWQSTLLSRLGPPFSITAQRAVARDSKGYYARVFVRVYQAGGELGARQNVLEQAMARAFQRQPGTPAFRRAALPHVLLHDGIIGLFFPAGEPRDFEVVVNGATRLYRAGAEDRFVPLSDALVKDVQVREAGAGQWTRFSLWEDDRPNRALLFAENGRLKARAQLNQVEPVVVPPGRYIVLSRFAPSGIEVEELSEDPKLYTFALTLAPGSESCLANGPAQCVIAAENEPLLLWSGDSRVTKEGVEFYAGSLRLELQFPVEWLAIAGRDYTLRITSVAMGETTEVPLALDESGSSAISVTDIANRVGWKSSFSRIVAEVRRPGEARILVRGAAFLWHGLRAITDGLRFDCDVAPANLQLKLCENAELTGDVVKPKEASSKTLRLVFGFGENRRQSLTWNLPGVYVEVDGQGEGSASGRTSRPLGSIEAVSYTSTKQVIITASAPGTLKLGNWQQHVDFSRRPSKVLPASFLASRITPLGSTLSYVNDNTGTELDLLRLLQPHDVLSMSSRVQSGQLVVQLQTPKELGGLLIHGHELISGESTEILLKANDPEWTAYARGRARMMSSAAGAERFNAFVYIDLRELPPGAWVLRFDAAVDGVWGHLENARQDWYGAGLLWSERGVLMPRHELLIMLEALDDAQSLEVLARVHKSKLPCYAREPWDTSLAWLDDAWNLLTARWRGRESDAITALIDLACVRPPEDCAPSWLLLHTVPAALPRLFALPAEGYAEVEQKSRAFPSALRAMADMQAAYPHVFPHLVHTAAAAAFENFSAMARGEAPRGFNVQRYSEALRELDSPEYLYRLEDDQFRPGSGDYLGPLHYRYARRSLELNYDRTLTGNELRRGRAINLSRLLQMHMPRLNDDCCTPMQHQCPVVTPWANAVELDDQAAQRQENLAQIEHLLSCLAFFCRADARMPGKLDYFLRRVEQPGSEVRDALAYLLQIGDALFGYYLVLWTLVMRAEPAQHVRKDERR